MPPTLPPPEGFFVSLFNAITYGVRFSSLWCSFQLIMVFVSAHVVLHVVLFVCVSGHVVLFVWRSWAGVSLWLCGHSLVKWWSFSSETVLLLGGSVMLRLLDGSARCLCGHSLVKRCV
jgi:hypothetical protein